MQYIKVKKRVCVCGGYAKQISLVFFCYVFFLLVPEASLSSFLYLNFFYVCLSFNMMVIA